MPDREDGEVGVSIGRYQEGTDREYTTRIRAIQPELREFIIAPSLVKSVHWLHNQSIVVCLHKDPRLVKVEGGSYTCKVYERRATQWACWKCI